MYPTSKKINQIAPLRIMTQASYVNIINVNIDEFIQQIKMNVASKIKSFDYEYS